MANRKGKGKASQSTPPEEPEEPATENEDDQLIQDLRQATLESKKVYLKGSSTSFGEGSFQPAVSVDNRSHREKHEVFSSDDEPSSDAHVETFLDAAEEHLHGKPSQRSKGAVYVVYKGRKPGIYQTWDACHDQVDGFPHNSYEGFRNLQDAQDAWNHSLTARTVGPPGSSLTHISSLLRTPPNTRVRTPQTPASLDRLAAITEGLRMRTGESGRKATQSNTATPQKCEHETPRNEFPIHGMPRWGSADAQRNQPVPQVSNGNPFLVDESLCSLAARAIGRGVTGVVRIAATQQEANDLFVKAYMSFEVKRFE